jgi:hypothetical protein
MYGTYSMKNYKYNLKMPTFMMDESKMLVLKCTGDYVREYEVKHTHREGKYIYFVCPECGMEHKSERFD